MGKYISFGSLSFRLLFPIINCIIFPFNYWCFLSVSEFYCGTEGGEYSFTAVNSICTLSVYFFTGVASVVLMMVSKAKWKGVVKQELKDGKSKNSFYFLIILCGILEMIASTLLTPSFFSKETLESFSHSFAVIQLLLLIIMTRLILKYPLYKHLILSLVLVVVGFAIIIIGRSVLYYYEKGDDDSPLEFLLALVCVVMSALLFSLEAVTQKYFMTKMGMSVYEILPFTCLGGFIAGVTVLVCQEGFTKSLEAFPTLFSSGIILVKFLMFLVSRVVIFIFSLLTIYNFTPPYLGSVDIVLAVKTLLQEIFSGFEGKKISKKILFYDAITESFGYLFALFGIIFFSEIIVLHFCGLDKNTRENVEKRGDIENDNVSLIEENSVEINKIKAIDKYKSF